MILPTSGLYAYAGPQATTEAIVAAVSGSTSTSTNTPASQETPAADNNVVTDDDTTTPAADNSSSTGTSSETTPSTSTSSASTSTPTVVTPQSDETERVTLTIAATTATILSGTDYATKTGNGETISATKGSDFTFEVNADEGNKIDTVEVGDTTLTAVNGVYTIPAASMTVDATISVTTTETVTHAVTFMNGEDTWATQNVEDGQYAVAPTSPSKEGFAFLGWYVQGDESQAVVDLTKTTITKDTTFVAKYTATTTKTITINYVYSDGTTVAAEPYVATVEIGSAYNQTVTSPVISGSPPTRPASLSITQA